MKTRQLLVTAVFLLGLMLPGFANPASEVTFKNGNVYFQTDGLDVEKSTLKGEALNIALMEEALRLTNEARAERGLAMLDRHLSLEKAALSHSKEMQDLDYFSHTSPTSGHRTLRERVRRNGLNPRFVAENIFECSGYDVELTVGFAIEAFLQSPGHRENLLNPKATHIGIGIVVDGDSVSVTQVFAFGL